MTTSRAGAGLGAILCAHADQNGRGAHWLSPGERCSSRPPREPGVWMGLDDGSPEEARANEERRSARIRAEDAATRRRLGLPSDGPCSTSRVETTDPFLSLVGDTGEVGALAACNLCGARLRLEAGLGDRSVFPFHQPGAVEGAPVSAPGLGTSADGPHDEEEEE